MTEVQLTPHSEVLCPRCQQPWAWLGDQGQSAVLYGRCLTCLLAENKPEEEADAMLGEVVHRREALEQQFGRRIFPCVVHTAPDCPRCQGRGWVVGYPPGFGNLAPRG